MDEDHGIQVTVTRLRRRLSVESEDSNNSPSTPSTPTKKRGGRLAAKPQLELIDEVNENVPKKTSRKSIARDVEKTADTVLTPARRSARIRSNTSLLADTPKITESPRAKRAARRTSQLGSDNDTPVAPVRQTRRTRKDSTASVDIAENENVPPISKPTRKTIESTDDSTKDTADDTSSNDQFIIYVVTAQDIEDTSDTPTVSNNTTTVTEEKDTGSPSLRKSPRLQNKKDNKTPPQQKGRKSKKSINNSTANEDTQPSEATNNVTLEKTDFTNFNKSLSVTVTRCSIDGLSGASVIEEVDIINKQSETPKPTLVLQELHDEKGSPLNKSLQIENSQSTSDHDNIEDKNHDLNASSDLKEDTLSQDMKLNKSDDKIALEKALEEALEKSRRIIQSIVVVEDPDSNHSNGKLIMDLGEDQCVPVVENQFENNIPINSEVEPMDIDETIPGNVTINDYIDAVNVSKEATVPYTSTEANINTFLNQSSILSISISKAVESSINKNKSEIINTQEIKPATIESENIRKNLSSNELDCDEDKNKSLNKSNSKSRSPTAISTPLKSDNLSDMSQSNKSKSKYSICTHSDINSNLHQSSNESPYDTPSNNENIDLTASSNKSQLNYSVQLDDGDSKKISSSVCSADKEEKSVNMSKRKSSLSNPNNSKLLQSPKNTNNETSNNKSMNSGQRSMATENNDMSLDNVQDTSVKSNQSRRKSSINKTQNGKIDESITNDIDNDKNSATIAKSESQNLEKSTNENKSTLVLSQLKDMSTNDTKNESTDNISRSDLTSDIAKNAKININDNYSTSTPLQQKSMQKLAMQINTSMISPSVTNKSVDVKPTKKVSAASSDTSDSSDEEQEEASKNKSKTIDDEASEASDDYESGDSRDDEERQYEEENEIREKGETLESEQDFSNNSDYEKDSFVVSSDEEDNDMLSGTGDDLSLSDRELTMSKKSKKKYDERKCKEQKKASREMFEARHNMIEKSKSNKKSKPKPLESSESESDNEIQKPKKKNRNRIDSNHEVSVCKSDADESIGPKKKKVKRLSESVCAEIAVVNEKSRAEEPSSHKKKKSKRLSASLCEENGEANEREITIYNESAINNKDPLVAAIKLEPKTPQKAFNISTVPIVDKMEEVQVDANMSVINSNETSDPLQATMAQDEDSLSSENAEIMQNYDSILNNLNDQKNIKNLDMSLNVNKKSNAKIKKPIIDQLNLTQTKSKKNKEIKNNKGKTVTEEDKDESDSSDSIDMQLLFPEDSNDSETNSNKFNQSKKEIKPAEEYIPLKKTPAKTDIPQKMDTSALLNNSGLNNSKSSNKKNKSLLLDETENTSEPTDDGIKIFIDTTGTLDLDSENTNTSTSKKKKKKHLNKSGTNESIVDDNAAQNVTVNNVEMEPPLEVIFKSDKKNKKKNKSLDNISITFSDTESNATNKINVPSIDLTEINETENKDLNTSHKSEKKKKKNKNKEDTSTDLNSTSFFENIGLMFEDVVPNITDTSMKSEKKKKKNSDVSLIESGETPTAKNKSKKLSESITIDVDNLVADGQDSEPTLSESLTKSNKKKKNKHNNSINEPSPNTEVEGNLEVSANSEKKKKNKQNNSINDPSPNTEVEGNLEVSANSEKKKKNKQNKSINEPTPNTEVEGNLEVSTNSEKKKKNKQNKSINEPIPNTEVEGNLEVSANSEKKKKNKQNKSINEPSPNTEVEGNLEVSANSEKKKKNKQNKSINEPTPNSEIEGHSEVSPKSEKKKKNKANVSGTQENTAAQTETSEDNVIRGQTEPVSISDDVLLKSKKKKKKKRGKNEQNVEQIVAKNTEMQPIGDLNIDSDDAPDEVMFKFEKATTEEINEQKALKRKLESELSQDAIIPVAVSKKKKRKLAKTEGTSNQEQVNEKASNKRKRLDGGVEEQPPKVFKGNSSDNLHVSRLPTSILSKLDDKPVIKKPKAIATSEFIVEDARSRKNKPSTYLEQSIYLNDTPKKDKKKHKNKEIPVVLPFIPTAAISDQGYTSKFKINILPQETEFVAQASNIQNFKNELLSKQRIKKLGTFEKFKSQRSRKLCKF